MALDSTATYSQVEDSYLDNASYIEDNSVTKAKAFVTACTMLIFLMPKQMGQDGKSITNSIEEVQQQKEKATQFLNDNDEDLHGDRVTLGGMNNYKT